MFLYKHFMKVRPDELTEVEDVVRNINFVLSSTRGVSSFLKDFGLEGFGDGMGPSLLENLTHSVGELLNKYEPRISVSNIEATESETGVGVTIAIDSTLKTTGEPVLLALNSIGREVKLRDVGVDEEG